MDIFQRCCLKEGIFINDLKEDETEIFEVESVEEIIPEEEGIEEEEKIDCAAVLAELELLKKRILKLQLMVKRCLPEEPEEDCVDPEVELCCSRNKEICALQKNNHKLQCQINELIRVSKLAKEMIEDLRVEMCNRVREVELLQKLVADLCDWRDTLAHEFGVCLERFEYLKHVKAEWLEVEKKLEAQRKYYQKREAKLVSKNCLAKEKMQIYSDIDTKTEPYKLLFEQQAERLNYLEQKVDAILEERKVDEPLQKRTI